ncbi:hypothetical protein CC78DRAFT_452780 [Lojkania enalia]|uniref:Protein kinase domain-containing protein n=1 Tax=Lojkania enalia TaxID=147567 RepID=A0A9P4TNT5_9PLEO|nr:hypothetical protein CC78DRAFT_452780 [Didymosphaeria enalia]
MSDPFSITGLGIGAASITLQIFDGCLKGYRYFESATNMTAECESIKIRIMMEYSRLQQWGDASGLTDKNRHKQYDKKMRVNAALIEAILTEIRSELKLLRKASLKRNDLELSEADLFDSPQEGMLGDSSRHIFSRRPIESIDLQKFEMIFHSPFIPQEKRRYPKGINGIISMAKGTKAIVTQPKRMQWALRDKAKITASVDRLKGLVDHLQGMLDETQMQVLLDTTHETWMAMLQIQSSVEGMQKLLEAMQADDVQSAMPDSVRLSEASTLVGSVTTTTQHNVLRNEPQTFYERLTFFSIVAAKQLELHESHIEGGYETTWSNLRISQTEFTNLQQTEPKLVRSSRTFASYQGRTVWIEWKPYIPVRPPITSPEQVATKKGPDPFVLKNVERLVWLLRTPNRPEEFCVPVCNGYFVEEGRNCFGIVYELKDQTTGVDKPTSLFERLLDKPPTLQERIRIARRLARCLMHLHAVNWLHKGIRSSNILFADSGSEVPKDIYISGLEYARPDEAGLTNTAPVEDLSWGEYLHPGYLGPNRRKGYRKTYDIYSLGIVLLEIAHWRPAERILNFRSSSLGGREESGDNGARAAKEVPDDETIAKSLPNLSAVRDRLLESELTPLEHVKCTMGERYHSVVRACLVGMEAFGLNDDLSQSDAAIAALLQQAYLRIVIDVLETITV